jgi:hypothetical protein
MDRQASCIDAAMLVRIWGMDRYCRPFTQLASVRNISLQGAVLTGVRSQVKPGEMLDVQYDGQHAQFRVVWSGKPGNLEAGKVGLERLVSEPCIWDIDPARCTHFVGNG